MALSLKFRRYRSRRTHLHTVTELRAEDNCTLWLRFDDGLEGHVYLGDLDHRGGKDPQDRNAEQHHFHQFGRSDSGRGVEIAKAVIKKLDPNSVVKTFFKDGDKVRKNTKVLTFKANARAILAAERTALNFIAHLSGIGQKDMPWFNLRR